MGSEASLKGNQKSTLYLRLNMVCWGLLNPLEECNKSDIRVTIINPGW